MGEVVATDDGWHGQPASAKVTIAPLSTVFLTFDGE
jgi:hypothetical protein